MTSPRIILHHTSAHETSKGRDEERRECIESGVESARGYTYPPLFSKKGDKVREIGGLQFPMDNGTLITP